MSVPNWIWKCAMLWFIRDVRLPHRQHTHTNKTQQRPCRSIKHNCTDNFVSFRATVQRWLALGFCRPGVDRMTIIMNIGGRRVCRRRTRPTSQRNLNDHSSLSPVRDRCACRPQHVNHTRKMRSHGEEPDHVDIVLSGVSVNNCKTTAELIIELYTTWQIKANIALMSWIRTFSVSQKLYLVTVVLSLWHFVRGVHEGWPFDHLDSA